MARTVRPAKFVGTVSELWKNPEYREWRSQQVKKVVDSRTKDEADEIHRKLILGVKNRSKQAEAARIEKIKKSWTTERKRQKAKQTREDWNERRKKD